MKKILLPIAAMAVMLLPAAANASACRDSANGKFAKCGTPGAVPDAQYVRKSGKPAPRAAAAPAAKPAAKPFSFFGAKPAAAPAAAPKAAPAAAAPAAKPATARKAPCKNDKGKFIKCAA